MKWFIILIAFSFCPNLSLAQKFYKSFYITSGKDSIAAWISVLENMLGVKTEPDAEEQLLTAEELYGFYDARNQEFIYSKPIRYVENGPVYGFMKLEVNGRVKMYSRKVESLEEVREFVPGPGTTGGLTPMKRLARINIDEFFLEAVWEKIKLVTSNEEASLYMEDDEEILQKLNSKSFKASRLKKLIKEYNLRNR